MSSLPSVGRWVDCRDHVWTTRCAWFWNTTQPLVPRPILQWLTSTKKKLWLSPLQSIHRHCPLRLRLETVVCGLSMRRSKNQEWSPKTAKRKTVKIATQILFWTCSVKASFSYAFQGIKNLKALGPDNTPPEVKEADIGSMQISWSIYLLQETQKKEEVRMEWKTDYITKLPKKGDLGDCQNRRGI